MVYSVFKTSCPRDCYGGCSIKVYVEDGRIVKLMGNETNRATAGKLCVKGMAYVDYVYSPNRVKFPMLRRGSRGSGEFEEISWEQAICLIGDKMTKIKETYGPLAVMHYSSGGYQGLLSKYYQGFFRQYGGYSTTRGNLCQSAGEEAVKLTYGQTRHNAPWDMENASLIILWGKNPAFTNVHEMQFINNALSKGCKLVTIDPIRNASSGNSDLHISPLPGTDMALALGVMNLLIKHNAVDIEFISSYTYGFDSLSEHVKAYTPDRVSEECKIPVEDIYSLAELLQKNRPVTLVCGYGLQRYKNGGQTIRAISMIPALLGEVGKRGSGFRFANNQWKLKWPYVPECQCEVRDDYPASMLGRAINGYSGPEIKMLWVERGNPMTTSPDTNGLKKSMGKLDFIVTVDQFLTDTARYSDIVLPAQSFFEHDDIITGYWSPYLSCSKKVIEPYYSAKNESEIYRMLGQYMGYDMRYLPEYNRDVLDYILEYSGLDVSFEMLEQGPCAAKGSEIAFEDLKFNTPSGKIELYSEAIEKKWNASPLPEYSSESKGYSLRLLSTHARERIHSQFHDIPVLKGNDDRAKLYINHDDADARGIESGDRVRIFNENGSISAYASLSDSIKPGVVNVYEGLPESSGANVNVLTCQGHTDIGNGAVYYDCYVEIQKCI